MNTTIAAPAPAPEQLAPTPAPAPEQLAPTLAPAPVEPTLEQSAIEKIDTLIANASDAAKMLESIKMDHDKAIEDRAEFLHTMERMKRFEVDITPKIITTGENIEKRVEMYTRIMETMKPKIQKATRIVVRMGGAESGIGLHAMAPQPIQPQPAQPQSRRKVRVAAPRCIDHNRPDHEGTARRPQNWTADANLNNVVEHVRNNPSSVTGAYGATVRGIYGRNVAKSVDTAQPNTPVVYPGGRTHYVPVFYDNNLPPIPVSFEKGFDIALENAARRLIPGAQERNLADEIASMPPMEYTILTKEQRQKIVQAIDNARQAADTAGNGCPLVDYGLDSSGSEAKRYGMHCGFVLLAKDGEVVYNGNITLKRESQGAKLFEQSLAKTIQTMLDQGVLSNGGYALFFDENTQRMASKVGQRASAPCIVAVPHECFVNEAVLGFVPQAAFGPKVFIQLESANSKRFAGALLGMLFDKNVAALLDTAPDRKSQQAQARREHQNKRKYTETPYDASAAAAAAAAAAMPMPSPMLLMGQPMQYDPDTLPMQEGVWLSGPVSPLPPMLEGELSAPMSPMLEGWFPIPGGQPDLPEEQHEEQHEERPEIKKIKIIHPTSQMQE